MADRKHDTVIFDMDGTLVDSTYHHAVTWQQALHEHGSDVETWRIHRSIGMGGDKIVVDLVGQEVEDDRGDKIRKTQKKLYGKVQKLIEPLPGVTELMEKLRADGFKIAVGSSGEKSDVKDSLAMLGMKPNDVDGFTTSDDAAESKPDPDIFQAALKSAKGDSAVVIGDSVYDIVAAARAGFPCIGVLTGGFSRAELENTGAVLVVENLTELLSVDWDELANSEPPANAVNDPDVN